MIGYVEADKPELKVREFDVYNGYYCGLCKAVGSDYSQILRKSLSYDMVFLAILLASLSNKEDSIEREHCVMHHIAKKPVLHDEPALDYSVDMMMILGYEKYLDDIHDGEKGHSFAGNLLSNATKKAEQKYPEVSEKIKSSLKKLYELEDAGEKSLDLTAQCFGDVMEAVFTGYEPLQDMEVEKRAISILAKNLGMWIYLIDAVDDFDDDIKNSQYNPLIFHHEGKIDKEEAVKEAEALLYHYLGEISKAYDLLDIKKNEGILDNIIYLGIRRKTDAVLIGKGNDKNGK